MQLATRRIMTCVVLIILGVIFVIDGAPSLAQPPNPVVTENALAGNPASEWDVIGEGDPTLQGFTTDISYNVGQTVEFKITAPGPYALYIYRMGYYNGAGARLVATIPSGSTTSPAQPACITDPVTGLYDCGNWSVTATWPIPANAVSGVYFAKALPNGQALNINNGSHIAWVVRDDARQSDILFQTQDTTWQAYNRYGTGSLYAWLGPGTSPGLNPDRAHKVSYNRPITTREYAPEDWVFNSEYPMIRWLERNGYDVTYISGVDAHRYPAELLDPTILLFIGHDEYWSQAQRDNVEAALAAGKHLAFFTGNEIFWRIRYENSIDGNNTPLRTMVGYKDSHNDEIWPEGIDPVDYTGTWRDPRIDDWEPDPENRLVGQIFTVNCCSYPIQVPSEYSNLRFWRNTSIATLLPGTQATLTQSTLGYEWDEALDNNDRPAGLFKMSSTTHLVDQKLLDYSSDFGPEIATHNLTMYKAPSGALVFGAGTIQWSWGLDGNHDRGETSPSADMQQATVNLFADMGNVQPETLQAGLIAATQSTDATAPTSTITSPSNGATVQMPVTVTGTAADSGGGVVAGIEISTDNGVTWRWATGTTNWTYVFSPSTPGIYVLRTRAVDDSGNLEVPSTTVTVTVEEGDCPCSLWDNSFVPLNPNVDDGSGLEIGVRFKASESGFITAIRFYKGVQNTGTHVGSLWTEGGTLLSQVTFTNETASGWQTMYLPSPVAITANTTYVASYHAPTGVHAETINYFSAGDWTRGPLTAFGAANGGNGVYAYSASPVFPTSVGGSYWNYWVDVLFVTEVVPDTTPPTVTSVIPNNGAIGVSVGSNVSATFSEPMIGATINGTSFELRDSLNNLIPAVVTYDVGGQTATLNPSSPLEYNVTYTATITTAVTDLAGLPLGANEVWSFTTEVSPPPPPDEGPGGPILVVSSALNPFSRYYAEILRAEGLNAFFVTDITFVDAGLLSAYDVVILGEMPLDSTQASMFATWVNNGGNLIAMRPDLDLAGLLGLTSVGTTLSDAWLLVNTTVGTPGEGIVNETIQFHGTADRYTLNGASALAWLYSTSAAATANPAVTMRSVGLNGGQAAAFTYDLAKSVVYTRQGNPTLAGVNTDLPITGNDTLRANDMFYPDWIDLNKAQIPTADEQQRLLANMILDMNADKKPLPRFWYLPRGERIVLLMTGDDHSSTSGTLNFFNYYRTQGLPGCSVEDWECIRATSYIYIDSGLTPAEAFQAEQDGFEVSIHPFGTACTNWDPATAATAIANEISAWQAKYALNRSPASNRNHCVTWTDFSTMAEASLANGIRLDTNYYYWPGAWLLDRPGYFNGSGLPMRFAQDNGQLIDVYQALTQLTDESQQTLGTHFQTLINNANDPTKHYIGVITANMHTDGALSYGANTLVPMALGNSVPVVSAYQMLTWLDGRNGSEFNNINWAGDQLTFDIAQASGARGLRAMLPAQGIAGPLVNLTRNGLLIPYTYETFKGVQYVTFDAENGAYVADYSVDSTGPVISDVTATVAPNNDVTITWTTNELSDSTVLFGTDPGTLSSSENNPLNTTAHSVTLFGLPLNTTFHYRVVSTDLSANTSTSPEPPALPLTFTTNMPSVGDTTTADFSNGTGGCTVWTIGDGAVTLPPTAASEFNGTSIPAGWVERSAPWNTGGFATVGSGVLSVDGQRVSTGSPYTANLTLEFVATFTSQAFQNGGFGGSNLIAGDFSEVYNNGPWAMFSTQNGGGLSARLNTPGGNADYAIPNGASYLGSPHLYRVEWTTTGFNFYIDGVLIHTSPLTVATPMYPAFSDFFTVTPLIVDWARVTPYNSPCTFTSRVFGSSTPSDWAEISWISTEPAGTAITMRVRTGETVVPDGSWSAWQPVTNGATVGVNSRYIQYEATLSTTDPFVTPVLELVSIEYNAGPDVTPPTIISRSPVQSATSVPVGTSVVVGFDELLDPASVTGAFTLRAQGAPSDVPATVTYNSVLATVTIDPDADLAFATTYTVTVAASVADLAGNPLGAPDTWTFTTEDAPPISLTDTTVVDFGAGSGDCVVWPSGDGAVSLAASLSDEFSGAALDPVWTVSNWQGLFNTPSATVSGGSVAVNDVLLATSTFYEAGHVFEARATFSADTFQHLGFAYDFSPTPQSWVMFSTGGSVDTIYARVNQNGSTAEVAIPGSFAYIGTPHVYRIEWLSNLVTFYVDGAQVYQLAVTLPGTDPTTSMRPMFSDFNNSAGEATLDLVVDWMRMSPVASPCTFTSRVFDGGGAGTWGLMSWQSTEPTGTAIAMEVRSGDTATPDGSWSGWTAISNNASIGASARYAQYRATLSTTDPIYSPELQLVELAFNAGSNTAPVAADDTYTTDEDAELVVDTPTGVLANDTDAETDPLTAVLVTDVTNGALTLNSDGSFTYTPNADFNGTDTFTYKANDGAIDSADATVTITVNPINDAPVAVDDTYTTDEDLALDVDIATGVLANDTDVELDTLEATVVTDVTNGTLLLALDGSFTYTPNADFNGEDTFTYIVNDGTVDSTEATVTITVEPVNDAPVAVDDTFATEEDVELIVDALTGVLANDGDVDLDPLTAVLVTDVTNGTLLLALDGSFTYTPNTGFNGSDSFTYNANDSLLDSNIATVTINVGAVNDPPVAVDDSYSTDEDTPLTVAVPGVLGNDTDAETNPLTAALVDDVTNGTLTLNANGSFTYTPNANFNGTDTFTYLANDGTANSAAPATVTIGPLTTRRLVTLETSCNDTTNPALILNANGSFTYTPNADFNGTDTFTYLANDGTANSAAPATVTITVNPVNDAPVAVDDSYSTDEDTPLTVAVPGVLGNDTDAETNPLTAVLVDDVTNGTLTLNSDGSFTYTPNANFNGTDTFTYKANDTLADSNVVTVTITVNPVNDAPVAGDNC
ncbi:MAG: tandem-95 repeat protein [Chloroflexi bacterium]|nr:tandem-95 repeat protein [Chloroflexota bacterium]